MSLFRNPYFLLLITTFIWGGNAVAGKFAVGHVSPMVLTLLRWAVAFVIITIIAWPQLRKDWPVIRKNRLYLLLMGGIGYSAFNFCMYSALQYTTAINVSLEQSAMPLVIFILNYALYKTGVAGLQIVGFFLTIIGVLITVSAGDPVGFLMQSEGGLNRGDVFMFFAALCYGGYSVALRSKPQMHWQSFLTALVGAALLFSFVGVFVEFRMGNFQFPVTGQGVLVVLYAGVLASLVAQGLFIKGVETLGANRAGLFINLVPIFGALLAVALLGEQPHLYHLVAFILVLGGITIAQRKTQ